MPTPYSSGKAVNSVKTDITNQSTVAARERFTTGSVISKDGIHGDELEYLRAFVKQRRKKIEPTPPSLSTC